MGGFNDFSTTASSNASVGAINFAEGQLPSTVNNSARQLMADLADVRDGNVVATGFHVKANGLTIRDQSDTTKKVIFDVSGQSAGTTKTIAMPITSGTLALAGDTAPVGASYIVVGSNGTLTNERVLTAGSNITLTDSSTAGTITVANSVVSFLAYNSANDLNVTGNGTVATIDFDTEVFDTDSAFASDTFTAPSTGKYFLQTNVQVSGISGATELQLQIVTDNRTYQSNWSTPPNSIFTASLSCVADMSATHTAQVRLTITGMAGDNADVNGAATLQTYFSGYRVSA